MNHDVASPFCFIPKFWDDFAVGFWVLGLKLMLHIFFYIYSKLEIVELKLKADSTNHGDHHSICSKRSLDTCQDKFQRHVKAVSSDPDATDKQNLWCEVLSVSRSQNLIYRGIPN